jgi:putative transposase
MVTIQQGLREDGVEVPTARLCRWFEMPRRTVYFKPSKAPPGAQARHRNGPKDPGAALVAAAPDERWATDLCRVWGGRDGWLSQALVIDCYSRQLGWHLSRTGKASTATAALEQALIARIGVL